MIVVAWIGAGLVGGFGALSRFRFDRFVQARAAGEFPFGTLAINLSGSFALGALTGAGVTGDALLVAGTGFIGAFTTFSTWMLETERLGEDGDEPIALLNLGVSIVAGLLAAMLGWVVGASL